MQHVAKAIDAVMSSIDRGLTEELDRMERQLHADAPASGDFAALSPAQQQDMRYAVRDLEIAVHGLRMYVRGQANLPSAFADVEALVTSAERVRGILPKAERV